MKSFLWVVGILMLVGCNEYNVDDSEDVDYLEFSHSGFIDYMEKDGYDLLGDSEKNKLYLKVFMDYYGVDTWVNMVRALREEGYDWLEEHLDIELSEKEIEEYRYSYFYRVLDVEEEFDKDKELEMREDMENRRFREYEGASTLYRIDNLSTNVVEFDIVSSLNEGEITYSGGRYYYLNDVEDKLDEDDYLFGLRAEKMDRGGVLRELKSEFGVDGSLVDVYGDNQVEGEYLLDNVIGYNGGVLEYLTMYAMDDMLKSNERLIDEGTVDAYEDKDFEDFLVYVYKKWESVGDDKILSYCEGNKIVRDVEVLEFENTDENLEVMGGFTGESSMEQVLEGIEEVYYNSFIHSESDTSEVGLWIRDLEEGEMGVYDAGEVSVVVKVNEEVTRECDIITEELEEEYVSINMDIGGIAEDIFSRVYGESFIKSYEILY